MAAITQVRLTVHQGLPITMKVQSRRPNGDYSEEIIRPTYPDYNTLDFEELYQAIVEGSPVKTTPADAKEGLEFLPQVIATVVE